MSANRSAVVAQAWQQVSGGKASVSLTDLCKAYKAEFHPRVVTREKIAESVMNDFRTAMGEH